MENTETTNNEQVSEETITVKDQIDIILRDLDLNPLPGRVVGTLCQCRRYIEYLETEIYFIMSQKSQEASGEASSEDSLKLVKDGI